METRYEIVLNMKTADGIVSYGRFQLGNKKDFAVNLFISLRGSAKVSLDSSVYTELVKWENGASQSMAMIRCSYLQLGENVRMITKELFKQLNLESNQ